MSYIINFLRNEGDKMRLFPFVPVNLKWVYDTSLSIEACFEKLLNSTFWETYTVSRVSCAKTDTAQLEIIFKNSSAGKFRRTRYNVEFYSIENGQTVVVFRFVDEPWSFTPCTTLDEIDDLLAQTINATRRK